MNLGFKKSEVQIEEISKNRAKFYFFPLERGYARTLGNDLRRVLLSSIPGTAVVGMKVHGINHEFQYVPGTINNGTDLVVNLKNMVFKVPEEEKIFKLEFEEEKAGRYYAKDLRLPKGVECLTPDAEFVQLNGEEKVKIDIFVMAGRGYRDAEEMSVLDGEEIEGLIKIDANFSPVVKVAVNTEKMRIGQNPNYEKLILDVETNGVLTPKEAITVAKFIIVEHLKFFDDMKPYVEELELLEIEKQKEEEILESSIEILGLSPRPYNQLKKAGYHTIGDVLTLTMKQLKDIDHIGKKSIQEIEEKLAKIGYRLKEE